MGRNNELELKLRCIIEKEGNVYSAICLDLDIASCGKTAKQAEDNLKEAIELYLQYAVESGNFDEMVPRHVPKHVLKDYSKKLRKASSEHHEYLRQNGDNDYLSGRKIGLTYQHA